MAAIEKVCECPKDNCHYHAGDMYEYKKNHLQVNPECRSQFMGLTAKCAIVSMYNRTDDTFMCRVPHSKREETVYHGEFYKANRLYYADSVHFVSLENKVFKVPMQYGMKMLTKPYVAVYVEEHAKLYINWLDSVKDIRAFKRHMCKLFGYDIPIKKDLKYKQAVSCDDLVRKMLAL